MLLRVFFASTTMLLVCLPMERAYAETKSIFDLVGDLANKPSSINIPIFTDAHFSKNSSCMLYRTPAPSVTPFQSDNLKRDFHKATWTISTWVTKQNYPNLCRNSKVKEISGQYDFQDKSVGTSGTTYRILFSSNSLELAENSMPFWRKVFGIGIPLYRENPNFSIGWPNLIVNKSMSIPNHSIFWMDQIDPTKGIDLIFSGHLNYAKNEVSDITLPPEVSLPVGASLKYDPFISGAQLRISIAIVYLLKGTEIKKYNCQSPSPREKNPICSANGRYFHFMISIYDNRFAYQGLWRVTHGRSKNNHINEDVQTHSAMLGIPLEDLMSSRQKDSWYKKGINPYQVEGQNFTIDANIFPLIKKAILELSNKNMPIYNNSFGNTGQVIGTLPPRLPHETADQYIGHFAIGSANIGYEISGLSDISFTIKDFKILDHLK